MRGGLDSTKIPLFSKILFLSLRMKEMKEKKKKIEKERKRYWNIIIRIKIRCQNSKVDGIWVGIDFCTRKTNIDLLI